MPADDKIVVIVEREEKPPSFLVDHHHACTADDSFPATFRTVVNVWHLVGEVFFLARPLLPSLPLSRSPYFVRIDSPPFLDTFSCRWNSLSLSQPSFSVLFLPFAQRKGEPVVRAWHRAAHLLPSFLSRLNEQSFFSVIHFNTGRRCLDLSERLHSTIVRCFFGPDQIIS